MKNYSNLSQAELDVVVGQISKALTYVSDFNTNPDNFAPYDLVAEQIGDGTDWQNPDQLKSEALILSSTVWDFCEDMFLILSEAALYPLGWTKDGWEARANQGDPDAFDWWEDIVDGAPLITRFSYQALGAVAGAVSRLDKMTRIIWAVNGGNEFRAGIRGDAVFALQDSLEQLIAAIQVIYEHQNAHPEFEDKDIPGLLSLHDLLQEVPLRILTNEEHSEMLDEVVEQLDFDPSLN